MQTGCLYWQLLSRLWRLLGITFNRNLAQKQCAIYLNRTGFSHLNYICNYRLPLRSLFCSPLLRLLLLLLLLLPLFLGLSLPLLLLLLLLRLFLLLLGISDTFFLSPLVRCSATFLRFWRLFDSLSLLSSLLELLPLSEPLNVGII